jgi:histone acetyltransferase
MERLLSEMQDHPLSWAFLNPVNGEEVVDYYEVITNPMGEYLGYPADCS